MPTEKRARQRAGRQAKLAAQAKVDKRKRLMRGSIWVVVGVACVAGIAYAFTAHSSPKAKTAAKASTTTTTATTLPTTTTTASTSSSTASTTSTTAPPTTTTTVSSSNAAAQTAANAAAVAAGCPSSPTTRVNTLSWSKAPAMTINTSDTYTATVKTTTGTFVVQLDAKAAPITVNSFVFLAQQKYFNCTIFHRVIPGFVDQGGDPTGTGTGGPGYQFVNENIPKAYATGELAMANSGPNTNGSQFFIVVPGGASELDSDLTGGTSGYSLFGQVTSGLSVVEEINGEGTSSGTPAVYQRVLSVTISQS